MTCLLGTVSVSSAPDGMCRCGHRVLDAMQGVGKTMLVVWGHGPPVRALGPRGRGGAMSADTLSDLLRAVRLRGAFFFYVQGADPWVVETSQASEIIPVIMPGVEHMMEFHGLARGSCWAAIVGQEPIKLDQGDVILFPQGDAHVMSSAPGMRARVMDAGV